MKSHHNQRTFAVRALGVLCILLALLVGFVSAVHIHPASANAADSSCPTCALAHAGVVLVEVGNAAPVFVASGFVAETAELTPTFRPVSSLRIRPPPTA